MQGVVITSIGWERVLLTLHGRVELASGGPGAGSFYLRLRDTEEVVPLPKVSFEGDRFEITINITQAVGRYPLTTGEWLLLLDRRRRDRAADLHGHTVPG